MIERANLDELRTQALDLLTDGRRLNGQHLGSADDVPWFIAAAESALARGAFHLIPQRRDRSQLYLARFWLSQPKPDAESGDRWDSADSILLHAFASHDDDQALHDHPWGFRTEILAGRYREHLAPASWLQWVTERRSDGSYRQREDQSGPAWDVDRHWRCSGDVIERHADDLHCVGHVDPGTWTLVRTGPRLRPWGFHPPGKPWVPWRTFLGVPEPVLTVADVSA